MSGFRAAFRILVIRVLVLAACLVGSSGAVAADEVSSLVRALHSNRLQERIDAARALAKLGPSAERAAPALAKALSDPQPELREQVRLALDAIGPGALEDLLEQARTEDAEVRSVITGLLRHIEPQVATLDAAQLGDALRALDAPDPDLRGVLGLLLCKTPPKYVERLFRAANWHDDDVYELVAKAIGSIGPTALPVLADELGSPSDKHVRLAILAIGYIGEEARPQVPVLLKFAREESAHRRGVALLSLARLGAEPVTLVPMLRKALDDPDESVGRRAREGLVALGDVAMPALLELLFEDQGRMRETAEELLARGGGRGRNAIEGVLPTATPERRPVLVEALVRVGVDGVSSATVDLIARWLADLPVADRRDLVRALRPRRRGDPLLAFRAVANLLQDGDADLRADAIRTLGVSLPSDVTVLGALFKDEHPRVRLEAAGACATGRVLIHESLRVVAAASAEHDAALRIRAAEILADLGKRALEALPSLETLARDPDPQVRLAALRAVAEIFRDPTSLDVGRAARVAALEAPVPDAIARGCDWLARHQDLAELQGNGGWDADGYGKHDGQSGFQAARAGYDVGVSALALLALLSAGNSEWGDPDCTRYRQNLEEGFAYLLRSQDEHGCIGGTRTPAGITLHGVATLALAEGWMVTRNPSYRQPLEAAVRYVEWARNPNLAWRYEPRGGENDTHITCWMVMALDAARRGGIQVDPDAFEGARQWVEKLTDPEFGQTGYNMPGGDSSVPSKMPAVYASEERAAIPPPRFGAPSPPSLRRHAMTAAAVWIRRVLEETPAEARADELGVGLILEDLTQLDWGVPDTDEVYWWFASRALHRFHGDPWLTWWPRVRDALVPNQVSQGRDRGSWNPDGVWGPDGGRIYSTAMAILTLTEPAALVPPAGGEGPGTLRGPLAGLEVAIGTSLESKDATISAAAREALDRLRANGN